MIHHTGAWNQSLTIESVRSAKRFLADKLPHTPLVQHPLLNEAVGAQTWVKLENTHALGAFKVRGGLYLLSRMTSAERSAGVCAATRGNHGQSLAFACAQYDAPCTIFVPRNNNPEKNESMRALGARIVESGDSFDDACQAALAFAQRSDARLVHPGKEADLVAGVGTLALEILEQLPQRLDVIFVPVGVGSCAAGVALVMQALSPRTEVIGVQSSQAPAMYHAWKTGELRSIKSQATLADGLAVGYPVPETLNILRSGLSDMVLVSEAEIGAAVRLYLRSLHQLAEGAGACALAAAMKRRPSLEGKRVGLVLTGGNMSLGSLKRVLHAADPAPEMNWADTP